MLKECLLLFKIEIDRTQKPCHIIIIIMAGGGVFIFSGFKETFAVTPEQD